MILVEFMYIGGGGSFLHDSVYELALAQKQIAAHTSVKEWTICLSERTFRAAVEVKNSFGLYVYRDELAQGTLMGFECLISKGPRWRQPDCFVPMAKEDCIVLNIGRALPKIRTKNVRLLRCGSDAIAAAAV